MMIRALLLAATLIPSAALAQQNFSCRYGTQGACLDYGDTVCSSLGKCVDADAQCFARYQCNFEGFTCKSNLTECADEYNALLTRYNRLVDDYNELLEDSQDMRTAFETALDDLDERRDDLDDAQGDLRTSEFQLFEITYCIENLGRFEDASGCLP